MVITDDIEVADTVLTSTEYGIVETGTYMGRLVATKTLTGVAKYDLSKLRKASVNNISSAAWDVILTVLLQRFCWEVVLWNALSHPNIMKFVGVRGKDRKAFVTVWEWMVHGNIMEYIGKNHVNRLELVRGFAIPAAFFTKVPQ